MLILFRYLPVLKRSQQLNLQLFPHRKFNIVFIFLTISNILKYFLCCFNSQKKFKNYFLLKVYESEVSIILIMCRQILFGCKMLLTFKVKLLVLRERERVQWDVYCTSPQCFKLSLLIRWLHNFGDFLNFYWLIH